MDARVVHQPSDVIVLIVAGEQVLDQVEQHLSADSFVSVYVAHILDVGHEHLPVVGGR